MTIPTEGTPADSSANLETPASGGGELGNGTQSTSGNADAAAATGGNAAAAPEAEAIPAYTPDYKFKVKNEEREFDEWLRPAIKDKETEEKIRALYTRSHGLDEVTQSRQQVQQQFEQVQTQHQQLTAGLQKAGNLIRRGDVFDAFEVLGIPEKAVMAAIVKRLEYEGLPEDQKRAYDQRRQDKIAAEQTSQENATLSSRYQDAILETREMQLQMAIQSPQVTEVASAIEQAFRSQGVTFKDLVMREGALEYQLTGRDMSVKEAVEKVTNMYRGLLRSEQQAGAPNPQDTVVRKQAQSIPNLGRGAAGVTGSKVGSLDDLKKLARAARENNS